MKIGIAVLVAVTFSVIGLMLLPGPSGFCYTESKFLSNDDVIQRVLEKINSYRPLNRITTYNGQQISVVELPSDNIQDMIVNDSVCCKVTKVIWGMNTKGEGRFDLFGWLFLDHAYYISGHIKSSFQLADGTIIQKISPIGDSNRVVGSCGHLKD